MNRTTPTTRYPVPISEQNFNREEFLKNLHNINKNEYSNIRWFQSKRIGKEASIEMAQYFSNKPTVIELKIYSASLLNDEAYDLVSFLEKNNTITSLKLFNSTINADGFYIIAQSIKNNTMLKNIKFSGNENREDVSIAIYIAEIIKFNKTLTDINLTDLNIDDDGIKVISEALAINTTLSKINLSGNPYSHLSANHLGHALEANNTITHIVLRDNFISIKGYKILLDKLKNNVVLTTIEIDEASQELYSSNEDDNYAGISEKGLMVDGSEIFESHDKNFKEYPRLYENIQSICQRNKEKESLITNATLGIKKLASELPEEIVNLIAQQLLKTEHDAATLLRLGDLV